MVFWILAALVLYLANVYLAGILLMLRIGPMAFTGPRDTLPEPSVTRGRALKSAANFGENLPVFLGLSILTFVVEGADLAQAVLGAQIFVLSRVAYIFVYIAGIPFIRSPVYSVGLIGMAMIALALI